MALEVVRGPFHANDTIKSVLLKPPVGASQCVASHVLVARADNHPVWLDQPNSLGGVRMAIRVAELARTGLTLNWMPGVASRCVSLEIKHNHHGERATTIVVSTERVKARGNWRTVEVPA